jgi:hypothetical protein
MNEKGDTDRDGTAGYFAWVRNMHGGASPEKYHWWRSTRMMAATTKHYENITIKKWPLTADEFAMDLDMLVARYPCPTGGDDNADTGRPKQDAG